MATDEYLQTHTRAPKASEHGLGSWVSECGLQRMTQKFLLSSTLGTGDAGLSCSNYYLDDYLAHSWARLESRKTC